MGPDLELKEKLKAGVEVLASKENGSVSQDPVDKLMECASNYEDKNLDSEALMNDQSMVPYGAEDVDVDIIGCTNSSDDRQVEARCEESTDSLSSFGDTLYDTENGTVACDEEVESQLHFESTPASFYNDYGGAFSVRRKKLTDHWRRFIRPIMWRCKWIELQMKELHAQAQKYDRELAKQEQKKQYEFETFLAGDIDSKMLPFHSFIPRKFMKRKKRKRFEETVNVASYMLQHNLFSYCENRKPAANGAFVDDDCGNLDKTIIRDGELGFNDRWTSLEPRNGDDACENILRKIEVIKSQVKSLKARIEKVVSDNPGKFASVNRLSMPTQDAAFTSSDQDPTPPPTESRDGMPVRSLYPFSQHISECNMTDLMPENAISNHGEVMPLHDMIESTDQPEVKASCKYADEGILVHNQTVKEEMQSQNNLGSQPRETPKIPLEMLPIQASVAEMPMDPSVARVSFGGKSIPKPRSNILKNKRKRRKRKSISGGRKRKT